MNLIQVTFVETFLQICIIYFSENFRLLIFLWKFDFLVEPAHKLQQSTDAHTRPQNSQNKKLSNAL